MAGGFWRETPGGITLHLRVTPNAGADRIDGPEIRDDGSEVLRLRVRAVPDGGKANKAVIALVARAFGVPKAGVEIIAGATARLKTIDLAGDSAELGARARQLSGQGRI
jgi:uncharacterized protein YggU (UPF0235/DUF167 family)